MILRYNTIRNTAQAEITEKKSVFISCATPLESEEAATLFIDEIKKKHHGANHNVFAYRIGTGRILERYSDDGEPAGTAGTPVLDLLRKENLSNIAVVVTRYFGGTLLGTGGLVRAYGAAAKKALLLAEIDEMILFQPFSVTVDYSISGKIQYAVVQKYTILESVYTDNVTFEILVEYPDAEQFIGMITNLSAGQAHIELMNPIYRFAP